MFSSMSSVASIYNYRIDRTIQKSAGNTYRSGQVQHCLACYESFLMVVFDLYIDNVHNAIEFTPA